MTMSKSKVFLEFDMKRTPIALLWIYIGTAQGLAKWFADDVQQQGKELTFIWNKQPQSAHVTAMRQEHHIRWRWDDDDAADRTYVELKIVGNEVTEDVMLCVTDFADEGDEDSLRDLITSQVEKLQRSLGC